MRSAVAATMAAPAVETTAAVGAAASDGAAAEPAPESVGGEPAVEAAQPLPAQLSGLMPLFVLGGRSAEAGPAPARGVFVPVALGVPTVDVAVPTRVHVASAEAPPADVVAE